MRSVTPLKIVGSALAMALTVAACSGEGRSPGPVGVHPELAPDPARALAIEARIASGQPVNAGDELGSYLNASVPGGFGGLFIGEDGRLKVYLKEHARRVDAAAQLIGLQKPDRRGGRRFSVGQVDFLPAKYDWDELRGWYEIVLGLGLAEIHEYDIDDKRNCIRLVVESTGDIQRVREASAAAGVPTAALIIDAEPRVSLAVGPLATAVTPTDLEDNDSPIRAAFHISTNAGTCTMTANTEYGSSEGFLTAAHCTSLWGDVTPPDTASHGTQGKIADEDIDPPFVGSGTYASCPTIFSLCRYSDAAMFEYDASGTGEFGIIARAKRGSNELETPDLSIEDDDPHCPWVWWCSIAGDSIWKIGKTTGLTGGTIEGVCVLKESDGRKLLCQERVEGDSDIALPGDSGAPAIKITAPGQSELWGVLWAADDDMFWFSRIENVRWELGDFDTVDTGPGGPVSRVPDRARLREGGG